MPVMDGLQATRQIRSMEGKSNLLILAMTANIFEDDRRACEDAGMNGFVGKPFEPDQLFSEILDWLSLAIVAPAPVKNVTEDEPVEQGIQDSGNQSDEVLREKLSMIEGMDSAIGLRSMRGDVNAYFRLLRKFDTKQGDDMQKLEAQLEQSKIDDAVRTAHSLKGAAATLGLTTLQESAKTLEAFLRSYHVADGGSDELSHLIDSVSADQAHFHQMLSVIIDEMAPE